MPSATPEPPTPSGGLDAWAESALSALDALSDVRRVGVALSEGGGRRLLFTASDRRRDDGGGWCHVDAYAAVPLNDAIRVGAPVTGALGDLDARYSAFVEAQEGTDFVAVATVPFMGDDAVLGGFVLYYDRVQAFDDAQHTTLRRIAADLTTQLGTALQGAPPAVAVVHDSPAGSLVAEHEIPSDPAAVSEARRFLNRTLTDWQVDEEITAQAVLCLSELVTNAVIHTTGGCHVQVELHDGVLTSRVHDNGAAVAPGVVTSHDAVRGHGHGLRVVDALSTRWGRNDDRDGAEVWFALEVS